MDFQVGEVIKMKKPHPCGANEWKLIRVGMDFRLQCNGCGRQVMLPRENSGEKFPGICTDRAQGVSGSVEGQKPYGSRGFPCENFFLIYQKI